MLSDGLGPLLVALVLAVGACSAGGGGKIDGGPLDAPVTFDVSVELPLGCPPATPNDKGIGSPCTKGGNECTGSLVCTCDSHYGIQLIGVPCVCTLAGANPQTTATDPCAVVTSTAPTLCGENATCCNYLTAGYYCSPNVCLPGGQCINFAGN